MPSVTETRSALVGRAAELDVLRAALSQAQSGRGRLVAVSGDAGIGKTRLVEELVAAADVPPARVLWGRCLEQEGAPSYWPWVRALRALAAARGIEALRDDVGTDAAALAPILPELIAADGGAPRWPAGNELEARYRLFEGVVALLRAAAAEPLVLVLEDVHWADEASLALLEYVASELDRTHLLLIVTYRERKRPRLPRALGDAVRRGQRIVLRGLDRDDVGAIVAAVAGDAPPPAMVDRIAEITDGNPFFLGEVVRALETDGWHATGPLVLPDSVRESLRRRLEPLGDGERDLLALAAVAGQEVDVAVLQAAGGLEATTVLERLHAPVEHGLVAPSAAGRFRFVHALVRETIYGDLLPATRVRLHARIGEAIERLYADESESSPLGTLAWHFLHAAPLGTAAKAVDYAQRAGQRAMGVYAYPDALRAFEQALDGIGADALVRPRRLELRLLAAEAASRAGYDVRARELYPLAAQDARAASDGFALFRAAVGYYLVSRQEGEPDPETAHLLELALAATGSEDSSIRAMLLGLLAAARHMADGGFAHEALSREAVEMSRRVNDFFALSLTLLLRQFVLLGPDSTAERLALCNEALPLTDLPEPAHAAGLGRTCCLLELGDVPAAIAEIDGVSRAAERLRHAYWQWQAAVQRAGIALLQGRFDDGVRLAAEALATRRNANDPVALQAFVLQMFLARRDTGHHGGLEGSIRWMVERYPETQMWRCVLAVFLADMNREDETRVVFEELACDGFRHLRQDQHYPAMLAWLARCCLFLRDPVRALQLYPLLAPYAERNIVVSVYSRASLGSAHRYLGLLCAAVGQSDAAEIHFRAAIAMNERMGARPVVACAQHEYARVLQYRDGPGDRAAADALLVRVRDTAEACGMTQLLEWLDRLGPSAPAPTPAPTAAPMTPPVSSVAVLRRDGDVWIVGFGGETSRMKDAKGVQLLVTLLQHPGQEVHALDLAGGGPGAAADGAIVDRGDAGPLLDPAARSAYKRRLDDLRDELEEAERYADAGRADRARHEMEFLAEELARGVGLGGRDRRAASAAERARVNVTRTIGAVMKKMAALHPRLGEHLRASVRMGYFCVYAPDPASPIRWEL